MDPNRQPQTLVILLFDRKLIRVDIPHWLLIKDLFEDIFYSGNHDIPPDIQEIIRPYKPRDLRYLSPRNPVPITDMETVPRRQDLTDLRLLRSFSATTRYCAGRALPSDGSCLNLVVEEPLPINELSEEGDQRFLSKEVVLYLNERDGEVIPLGHKARVAPGYIGALNTSVWCKLVGDDELETFKTLEPLSPSSHRIATLVLPPYLLPTGQHLIAMPDYGYDLNAVNGRSLSGTRLHVITRQLIEAIQFLHSHNLCHLDIKPHNLAMDHRTSDLTVIDLGWVMYGKPPCVLEGSAGTYECVAPEVRKWFDWEETEEGDPPPLYDPWKADAWAIGYTVRMLMDKEEVVVDGWHELDEFSRWMMEDRPSMIKALERFDAVFKSVLDISRQNQEQEQDGSLDSESSGTS